MSPVIWNIARTAETPHKRSLHRQTPAARALSSQVLAWTRVEKYSLIAILIVTVFLYGVVVAMYWHAPLRELLGW